MIRRRGPDAGQDAHGLRPEQGALGTGAYEHEPVRLRLFRADLREHLGRGEPHRPVQPGHASDVGPQPMPHGLRRSGVPGRLTGLQIDERLVQAEGLHERRKGAEEPHHLLTDRPVQPEARHQIGGMRGEPARLPHRHRRVHPELPRLVRRRGHDTARTEPAHDDRFPAQARLRRLLRRGVEGIHVEMQDRGRGSHITDAALRH